MSIQHALLTSLLEKPSSGFELARRFDRSIGYFWSATHQQIYRELGRMAEAGWVRAEDETAVGKRRRKTYYVLPAGRQELLRWVTEPGTNGDQREAFLVKLRAEAVIGPSGLDQELQRQIEAHHARLALYRDIERRDFSSDPMPTARRLQHAVLRYGIMTEENWLAWANDVLPLLPPAKHAASS